MRYNPQKAERMIQRAIIQHILTQYICKFETVVRKTILASQVLLIAGLPISVFAQSSFSWKDSSGRTVYGSKPPKSASSVSTLKTRELSRYSSDKVLKRSRGSDAGTSVSTQKKAAVSQGKPARYSTEGEQFLAASFEKKLSKIDYGENRKVTYCEAEVSNIGVRTAKDVSVAFEFSDGTLVPAVGPGSLDAGKRGSYTIPDDLLPLEVEPKAASEKPEIIVHGLVAE